MPWDIRTAYITFWNENLRGDIDVDGKIIFMWILVEQDEHLWNELHLLNIGAFGKMIKKF